MKYWLLTTEFPPHFGGGIGTYCSYTAEMLSQYGYDVTVFINDPALSDIKEEKSGATRLVRFNPSRTRSGEFLGHVTNISYEFAAIVKEYITREGSPAIIEAQEYQGIAYYLLQFKRLMYEWCRDIPILITAHSPSFLYLEYNHVPIYKYPNYWIGEMERFSLQAADHVIFPSGYLIDEIRARFQFENRNFSIVVNPYPINDIPDATPSLENDGQIIFFGKLSAQKGTFKLLSYFQESWDNGFPEKLILVGGSDIFYYPAGKTMGDVVRTKWNKYLSAGLLVMEEKVQPSLIRQRLAKAKLVIIPSTVDNLPYVVLEAMSAGCILLVSRQGGQAEIVQDGVNGFVFDHNEEGSFEKKLKEALALSPLARQEVSGRASESIATRYNYEVVFEQKQKILQQLQSRRLNLSHYPFIRSAGIKRHSDDHITSNGLLSIVVPYYNMGQYIDETMRSLQAVDYPNKEIIIVNDGSTDAGSVQQLGKYRHHAGITVIDTANQGLSRTRNAGAVYAKGEFLAFLDADDTVEPSYYSRATRVLSSLDNVAFVGAWVKYFDASRVTWPTITPEPPLILYHNLVNSSALVYRRSGFLSAGLNDARLPFAALEDYDSVLSMLAAGYGGVVLPEILFHYRVRPGSMIRQINFTQKLVLSQYISSKHAALYAIFAAELFNLQNANGSGLVLDNPTMDYQLVSQLPFGKKYSGKIIAMIKRNKLARSVAYKLYRLFNK